MKILFAYFSFDITKFARQCRLGSVPTSAHLPNDILQFGTAASSFVFFDSAADGSLKLVATFGEMVNGIGLIYLGNLFAEVA